jgi:hypothetical protein
LSDIREGKAPNGTGPRVFVGPGIVRCVTVEIEIPSEPDVGAGVRQLVSRMLRIDPRQRPISIGELVSEVQRLRDTASEPSYSAGL